jgi:hypothetical protein
MDLVLHPPSQESSSPTSRSTGVHGWAKARSTLRGFQFLRHPEYLITDLDQVQVLEVLPLAEILKRGEEEKSRGINWWDQVYGSFGSVVDWWFYYDRNKDRKYQRKGLVELKEKWLKEHPGFKDPDEYYRKRP